MNPVTLLSVAQLAQTTIYLADQVADLSDQYAEMLGSSLLAIEELLDTAYVGDERREYLEGWIEQTRQDLAEYSTQRPERDKYLGGVRVAAQRFTW